MTITKHEQEQAQKRIRRVWVELEFHKESGEPWLNRNPKTGMWSVIWHGTSRPLYGTEKISTEVEALHAAERHLGLRT